jgi:hypothetical protein
MTVPAEVLRELLRYEPGTGRLFWLPRNPEMFISGQKQSLRDCARWNARYAGKEAFTVRSRKGYRRGCILNQEYLAHRVIWALVTGSWPPELVDHINGDTSDNRLCNLRMASAAQNQWNQPRRKTNTSGFKGVYWHRRSRKWNARIKANGLERHLGMFGTPEEAAAAYSKASSEFHGAFGRAE